MTSASTLNTDKYTQQRVIDVHRWSDGLFSFTITRPDDFKFTAGQFARIGISVDDCQQIASDQNNPDDQSHIFRAYSVVSSPYEETLEFFSIVVPDGAFTSRLVFLEKDDHLWLDKTPYGFLTLGRFQEPEPKNLWLLATGTGLAPFLSILQDFDVWQSYEDIILVYSARTRQELAYGELITRLKSTFGENGGNFHYIPVVTREPLSQSQAIFDQRINHLIDQSSLTSQVGVNLDSASHVMLCGNPAMIEDTKVSLKSKGLTMNRRAEGNIAVENYW